ncbi:class I SAM-dependent methyltransferase [Clostridium sp. DL1XJH146]
MNKNSLNKIKLFFTGLENRYTENTDFFKEINFEFKSGLKSFKGTGKFIEDKIKFNFNGKSTLMSFSDALKKIQTEAEKYEAMNFLYIERFSQINIIADNKKVTMNTKEIEKKEEDLSKSTTSTILNRDYFIKVGKGDKLLKEIEIMTKDGKIKNDKIRKYNQIDHYVELLDKIIDELPKNEIINIVDCGCGKSYLSFVLNYYITEVKRKKCHFTGIDISEGVIARSKEKAEKLSYRNMEFLCMDLNDYKPSKNIHLVLSLHACDTATDMAIALGIKVKSDVIIAVPCCHKELSKQVKSDSLNNILKHGILKTRFADLLTDGMRSLMLEAKGYDVSVVEYISPLETPKNLMIRAKKERDSNDDAMAEYHNLMATYNVYPALYAYLNEFE